MLDKSKPYGLVYGEANFAYEQNNKLYNAGGKEVDSEGNILDIGLAERMAITDKDDIHYLKRHEIMTELKNLDVPVKTTKKRDELFETLKETLDGLEAE